MQVNLEGVRVIHIQESPEVIIVQAEVIAEEGTCPRCQTRSQTIHERRVRRVRDLPMGTRPLVIQLTRRNFVCINPHGPGKTFLQSLPDLGRRRRTAAFRQWLVSQYCRMPAREVRDQVCEEHGVKVAHCTVYRDFALASEVKREQERGQIKSVRRVGLDDFKRRKPYKMGAVLVGLPESKILGIEDTRSKEALVRLLKLVEKADLEAICIDMNACFYRVCRTTRPGVPVVIDRFHVVDEVQEALKRVINRVKREMAAGDQKAAKHLWNERWVLLAAEENLDKKVVKKRKRAQARQQKAEAHKQAKRKGKSDREVLTDLCALDRRLEQAWRLKESLRRMYDQPTADGAERHLSAWMEQAQACGLSEFHKLAQTFQQWREPILAYFQLTAPDKTSGKTERQVEVIKDIEKARHKFDKCENLEGVVFLRQDRVPGLPLTVQFSH